MFAIGGAIRSVAAWMVIIGITVTVIATVLVPRAFGGSPFVILTASMRPELPPGTVVVTRTRAPQEIEVGTVLTYQVASGAPEVVTHRVVARGVNTAGQPVFRTRGDANSAADPGWVKPVQIRGVQWYAVPYVGLATRVVDDQLQHLFGTVLGLGLLCYAVVMVSSSVRGRRSVVAP